MLSVAELGIRYPFHDGVGLIPAHLERVTKQQLKFAGANTLPTRSAQGGFLEFEASESPAQRLYFVTGPLTVAGRLARTTKGARPLPLPSFPSH